jgi:hypothetical protein
MKLRREMRHHRPALQQKHHHRVNENERFASRIYHSPNSFPETSGSMTTEDVLNALEQYAITQCLRCFSQVDQRLVIFFSFPVGLRALAFIRHLKNNRSPSHRQWEVP